MLRIVVFWGLLVMPLMGSAIEKKSLVLSGQQGGIEIINNGNLGFTIILSLDSIEISEQQLGDSTFTSVSSLLLEQTFHAGSPNIPVLSRLIEVPSGAEVSIAIVDQDELTVSLAEHGFTKPIVPAQPSVAKSDDPEGMPLHYDPEAYRLDTFLPLSPALAEGVGNLRSRSLGRIELWPIRYNPVQNALRVATRMEVEVRFEHASSKKSTAGSPSDSPFFQYIPGVINQLARPKALINSAPVTYVIVSDPMFQEALQPFVAWKRLKGFHVIEAYTNNPTVGNTTTSIKNYLQGIYHNPPEGYSSPTFGLLVGDVAQIPAFSGSSNHVTDLYYFEYTGDRIPEVYYGRFSAQNVAQLVPQIQKTLEYEQYLMADPSYLANHLLVAGVDRTYAPKYGNGHIRYAHTYYSNPSNGVTPFTYLFNDTQGSTSGISSNSPSAAAHIQGRINSGVGWANYTAHCSSSGWTSPAFSTSNVHTLTNHSKYGVWMGNCCESSRFNINECFGEAALRASGKGAVGYIGASNLTYWDEDYFFAVGVGIPSPTPSYADTGPGLYDALFHTQPNEALNPSAWFIAQGQLNMAGNLAVQASTSQRKNYYWEVYHLLGDPSLVPYLRQPSSMAVTVTPEVITIGTETLTISCAPHAHVALSQNGELIGVGFTGNSGLINLPIEAKSQTVGSATLVITAQNHIPHIQNISITASDQPFIALNQVTPSSSPIHGNEIGLNIVLQNLAGEPFHAYEVRAFLHTESHFASIISDSISVGNIPAMESRSLNNVFTIALSDEVPDQTSIPFTLVIHATHNGNYYQWNRHFSIKANAPQLSISPITISTTEGGQPAHLNAGDTGYARFTITNTGHAPAHNPTVTLQSLSLDVLTIMESGTISLGSLPVGGQAQASFQLAASPTSPLESIANLRVTASSGNYVFLNSFSTTIGVIPNYLIAQQGTITGCPGRIFDSGGQNVNYSNNENFTITLAPSLPSMAVMIEFSHFDLEVNYDFLFIYNGESTSSPQIAGSPFTGNQVPPSFMASNPQGAITLRFTSDNSISRTGWAAHFSCIDLNLPPNCPTTPGPVNNGTVSSIPTLLTWDMTPGALRYDLYLGIDSLPDTPTATLPTPHFGFHSLPHKTYKWRVVPRNNSTTSQECPIWTFSTTNLSLLMKTDTLSVCGIEFFDSGGQQENYSNNENSILTLYPNASGSKLRIEFSGFNLENDFDFLSIFDGPSVNHSQIANLTGTALPKPLLAQNPEGALTFRFKSDVSITRSGWRARISCVPDSVLVTIAITDTQGKPIEGAQIQVRGLMYHTDTNGYAQFLMPSNSDLILSASKDGYEPISQGFATLEDSLLVRLELLKPFTLTLTPQPLTGGQVSGGGIYIERSNILVSAQPNPGFIFGGWLDSTGSLISTHSIHTLTIPHADTELTARFDTLYSLTVLVSPSGLGTVTGEGMYPSNYWVTLSVSPIGNAMFKGFYKPNGTPAVLIDGRYLMPPYSHYLVAVFQPLHELTLLSSPPEGGTVSGGGFYTPGTPVAIQANPNAGFTHSGWHYQNNAQATLTNEAFTMPDSSVTLTATFKLHNNLPASGKGFMSVFPNPFSEYLLVSGEMAIDHISITSITGQVLSRHAGGSSRSISINTQLLPVGAYMLWVTTTDGSRRVWKVVKGM